MSDDYVTERWNIWHRITRGHWLRRSWQYYDKYAMQYYSWWCVECHGETEPEDT